MNLIIGNIVVGAIYIMIMLLLRFFPPKKINGLYGYRTNRSMASQTNWDYAHALFGKYLLKILPFHILTHVILLFFRADIALLTISIIFILELIILMVIIEKKLKKL